MEEYTTLLASNFDALRIDNCHSTPIHVGEHFLDIARRVNPNVYVIAELSPAAQRWTFTSSAVWVSILSSARWRMVMTPRKRADCCTVSVSTSP